MNPYYNGLLLALFFDFTPTAHISIMRSQRLGKHMSAGTVSDKINRLAVCRIEDGGNGSAPRIGNRCRRQAVNPLSVIGGLSLDLTAPYGTPKLSFAADNTINNRRVGLQAHAFFQAIGKGGSDQRTLLSNPRFALND